MNKRQYKKSREQKRIGWTPRERRISVRRAVIFETRLRRAFNRFNNRRRTRHIVHEKLINAEFVKNEVQRHE